MLGIYASSYVFAEFSTVDEANIAITAIHGSHFDKSHPLFANRFTDIEKFAALDEKYVEPTVEPFAPKVSSSFVSLRVPGLRLHLYLGTSEVLARRPTGS